MPKGVYQRDAAPPGAPLDDPDAPDLSLPADDGLGYVPGLIVPTQTKPNIDLTRQEDAPDQKDGEWSLQHLAQFLARQPRSMVFVPKEGWEPKAEDTYQYVGLQGHRFRVLKGKPVSVPIQIATIIEQSQDEFPTQQSRLRRRQVTDIRDLPQSADSRGVPGVEVYI